MRRKRALAAALGIAVSAALLAPAQAGHEFPYYPSYYPAEIRIETVAPQVAAQRLRRGALHAFIGEVPFPTKGTPGDIGHIEFLGAYVIATFDGPASSQAGRDARCALADKTMSLLSSSTQEYVFHPYPMTPFHADYLFHYDLIESLRSRYTGRSTAVGQPPSSAPTLRTKGPLVDQLVRPSWRSAGTKWDATVEAVEVEDILSAHAARFETWLGPPWLKEGWFHAYLLLAPRIRDRAVRLDADTIVRRLAKGDFRGLEEKVNLERRLMALLTHGCEAAVVGYTVRRAHFNTGFSSGIENVAFDSQTGLNSPMFIRTAKLKDFPWNGWLRLGINERPAAAWNPIGGFTDAFGQLVWAAVGDPAFLPTPYGASWIANRVSVGAAEEPGFLARLRAWIDARIGRAGLISVPRDALVPMPGTGLLQRVGTGKKASAKIVYTVLTSSFHDGSPMSIADVLYPYALAYRWGGDKGRESPAHDGFVEKSTALMRERLVGFRVARIDQRSVTLGDIKQTWLNPVVEVYVHAGSVDRQQLASVAPPWASVPWHVMALMEEAVRRGMAAFSEEEAKRRGVEWLDLARRSALTPRLVGMVDELSAQAYVPEALQGFVTADEARQRWRALKRFYQTHRHFLVTNGPYRLEKWTEDAVVLGVFRDLSYPLGIGAFDTYPVPHRGYISGMTITGGQIQIRAEVESVEKAARDYRIIREPLTDALLPGAMNKVRPVCRYVAIGPDGRVVKAGTAAYAGSGVFAVDLGAELPRVSTIVAAVYVDDNYMGAEVRMLRTEGRR